MGMRQLDPEERNITMLFEEVRAIKNEMEGIIVMLFDLRNIVKNPRSTHNSQVLEGLMHQMNPNLEAILEKAKTIKTRLDSVNKSNAKYRTLSDAYKEGSPVDLTGLMMTHSIKLSLDEMMEFKSLRAMIFYDRKGKRSSKEVVGIGAIFKGDGRSVAGNHEMLEAMKEMERYFNEIYQVFLEMAVMVQDSAMMLRKVRRKSVGLVGSDASVFVSVSHCNCSMVSGMSVFVEK